MASVETDSLSRRNSNDSCSDEDRVRMIEEDRKSHDDEEFKDKILNTKLSEENKENNLPTQRKLLRGQSQVVLPVKIE